MHDRRAFMKSSAVRRAVRIALAMASGALPLVAVHAQAPVAEEPRRAPDKFMITAIDVSGVTKLSAEEIERIVYPHLGPDRSNDDVVAAQKGLQEAYAAKGYEAVLVDVPVQPEETFAQGIVQIAVSETPVGRVRVVGADHHPLTAVRAQMPSVVEGQPIDFKALQRDVAQANRVPDRSVEPRFTPGQVPGTLDIDLKVEDSRPLHASIDLSNDNSPSTEPLRLAATVRHTDLWSKGHSATFTYSVAPQNRQQSEVFSASYSAPLLGTPWSFMLSGYTSNSNVAALGGTQVLGDGFQIGLRAIYRLPSETFQQISFGVDFKDFNERLSVASAPLDPKPVRYVPLVAEYTFAKSGERQNFNFTLGTTAGFRVVKKTKCEDLGGVNIGDTATCTLPDGGVGVPVDILQNRAQSAIENFVHFNLDASYSYNLPKDWIIALHFVGQFSDSPLVTNEQFGVGGMTSVRGYYLTEAIGDDGFVSSVEAQLPDLAHLLGRSAQELRFYAFGDFGYARIRAPAAEQAANFYLASLGGGVRYRLLKYLSGEFLIGVPVRDGPITRGGDPRYSFSLKGEF